MNRAQASTPSATPLKRFSPLKISLIGAARSGSALAAALKHHPSARLHRVSDALDSGSQALCEEYGGIPTLHADQAITDPHTDAVCFTGPLRHNADLLYLAIASGKRVLCENLQQMQTLHQCQALLQRDQYRTAFMLAFPQRFDFATLEYRELLPPQPQALHLSSYSPQLSADNSHSARQESLLSLLDLSLTLCGSGADELQLSRDNTRQARPASSPQLKRKHHDEISLRLDNGQRCELSLGYADHDQQQTRISVSDQGQQYDLSIRPGLSSIRQQQASGQVQHQMRYFDNRFQQAWQMQLNHFIVQTLQGYNNPQETAASLQHNLQLLRLMRQLNQQQNLAELQSGRKLATDSNRTQVQTASSPLAALPLSLSRPGSGALSRVPGGY